MNQGAIVYIVDDDPELIRSTSWLLEAEGFRTKSFASSRAFLHGFQENRPSCLLLDIQMPETNGLELQQMLASRGQHVPIVFLTGFTDVPQCVRAMKAGAVDFLMKPVDFEILLAAVKRALNGYPRRRGTTWERSEVESRLATLTSREQEVMQLLFDGISVKQIASQLGISFQTVAKHRTHIMEKMCITSEAELVRTLVRAECRLP